MPEWILQCQLFQILTALQWSGPMIPPQLRHLGWTRPNGQKFELAGLLIRTPPPNTLVALPALVSCVTWTELFGTSNYASTDHPIYI